MFIAIGYRQPDFKEKLSASMAIKYTCLREAKLLVNETISM